MTARLPRSFAVACMAALLGISTSAAILGSADAQPSQQGAVHAAKHHRKHHRHHHSRIPQHNGGDHDADNNGGPTDGDGNV
jgi:hypothetical protein